MGRRANGEGTRYKDELGRFCWRRQVGERSIVRKAKTKTELDRKIKKALEEIDSAGTAISQARDLTVGAFLRGWSEIMAPTQARKTRRAYSQRIEDYLLPRLGKLRLQALTSAHVQAAISALVDDGLSAETAKGALVTLKAALNWAMRQSPPIMMHNPAKGVLPPKGAPPTKRFMAPRDMDRLLLVLLELSHETDGPLKRGQNRTRTNRYGPMLALIMSTGLRISEAMGLKWSDIDFGAPTPSVRVTRSLEWVKKGVWELSKLKSTSAERELPLNETALRALRMQGDQQSRDRVKAGEAYQSHDLVFTSESGKPVSERNIQRALDASLKRCKPEMEHYSLHDLRRACLSRLARNGTPPHVLRYLAGHASINTTMAYYVGVFADERISAIYALDGSKLPEVSQP